MKVYIPAYDKPKMEVTHVHDNRFTCTSQSGEAPYTVILSIVCDEVYSYCTCPSSRNSGNSHCKHGAEVKKYAIATNHPIYQIAARLVKFRENAKADAVTVGIRRERDELYDRVVVMEGKLSRSERTIIALKATIFDLLVKDPEGYPAPLSGHL